MPDIRILTNDDQAAMEKFLLPRIEGSMFLLGNSRLAGLEYNDKEFQGTYVAAFDGEDVTGVAAHFWNGMITSQAPLELIPALVQKAMTISQRPAAGAIGVLDQADVIAETVGMRSEDAKLDDVEILYKLSLDQLVEPEALASGKVVCRAATPEDEDLLTEWRAAFSVESLGETMGPELLEQSRQGVRRYTEIGQLWVLEEEGNPVSTSAFNAAITEAVQVGGVYTPPEFRSRGHGRNVVASTLIEARDNGAHTSILFTDTENIPAQKAYEALGFEAIGKFKLMALREPIKPAFA